MSESRKTDKQEDTVTPIEEVKWGETRDDHMGYDSEHDRVTKRGLEDWEMVEKAPERSDHHVPYWFFAIFIVLLVVATGLTFPFWGVRPGFERSWFDWGIPAGIAWVVTMSILIYYMVDYRHARKRKQEEKREREQQNTADPLSNK